MSHPRDVAFTRFYNRFEPKVATSSLSGQSDSFSSSAPCSPMKRVCPYAHSHEIGAKVDKSLSGTAPAVALKWHGVGLRGADLERRNLLFCQLPGRTFNESTWIKYSLTATGRQLESLSKRSHSVPRAESEGRFLSFHKSASRLVREPSAASRR